MKNNRFKILNSMNSVGKTLLMIFASVFICESAFTQCYSTPNFILNGSASDLGSDEYQLTPENTSQGGSVWNEVELSIDNAFTVEAELYFGTIDAAGSDGIAFVLQTDPDGSAAVSTGGSIGYGGITPSFIVEFDTYCNSHYCDKNSPYPGNGDEPDDHLAIQKNGDKDHLGTNNLLSPIAIGTDANFRKFLSILAE